MTDYTVDDYAEACKALALGEPVHYYKNSNFVSPSRWTLLIPPAFDIARAINWRATPKPPKTKRLYPYAYQDAHGLWNYGGWVSDECLKSLCGVRINDDGTIDVPEDL